MDYNKAKELLEKYGQEQLLRYYDELNDDRKASLLKQIEGIDFSLLDLIKENSEAKKGVITPLDSAVTIEDIEKNKEKYTNIGISAIKEGKVGALLLAGGMGTRLGSDKPKGMYNIGLMTSEKNNDDTIKFFEEKNYFGYNKDYVDFFVQEMAPAASFEGKIYLEDKDRVSTSPNGNGGWFISFVNAGLAKKAKEAGVEYINVFAVDNVCQRMADPCFVGAMIDGGYRSASKVVSKATPEEKVGVLCLEDLEKNLNSNLVVHVVKKKVPYINEAGEKIKPETENGYKFETLVLDMVHMMDNCLAYEVVREKEFAPIKNKTGVDSVDSARELLKLNGVEL